MEEKKLNYEVRTFHTKFEVRNDEQNPKIRGYFVVWDQEAPFDSMMSESIDRHALDNTIHGDIRALWNHDTSKVMGRTTNGTLQLSIDDYGLFGEIDVNPKDSEAMNNFYKVERGDVDQCSFGFNILRQEPITREDGGTHWVVKEVELFEVSPCTFPFYETTSISARSKHLEEIKKEKEKAWKDNLLKKLRGEK